MSKRTDYMKNPRYKVKRKPEESLKIVVINIYKFISLYFIIDIKQYKFARCPFYNFTVRSFVHRLYDQINLRLKIDGH